MTTISTVLSFCTAYTSSLDKATTICTQLDGFTFAQATHKSALERIRRGILNRARLLEKMGTVPPEILTPSNADYLEKLRSEVLDKVKLLNELTPTPAQAEFTAAVASLETFTQQLLYPPVAVSMLTKDDKEYEIIAATGSPAAKGGFGTVFLGYSPKLGKMALKRPTTTSADTRRRFEREINFARAMQHEHLLPLWGVVDFSNSLHLVTPWIPGGNLFDFVKSNPDKPRVPFLLQIAKALVYLHDSNFVHGDIKAANALVSHELKILLCDFGLMKDAGAMTSEGMKGVGTVPWQSPEQFSLTSRTFASDVYAFGITIAEVLSGDLPFGYLPSRNSVAITAAILSGKRPLCDPPSTKLEDYEKIWRLAKECWSQEPGARPHMSSVLKELDDYCVSALQSNVP